MSRKPGGIPRGNPRHPKGSMADCDETMTKHDEKTCFACGTCTAGCPVADVNPEFDPRRIVRQVILGLVDDRTLAEIVWLCADCHTCQERCPQGVPVNDLIMALRNLSAKGGRVPQAYRVQIEAIRKDGRIYEIADFNKKREKAGLPALKDDGTDQAKVLTSIPSGPDDPGKGAAP